MYIKYTQSRTNYADTQRRELNPSLICLTPKFPSSSVSASSPPLSALDSSSLWLSAIPATCKLIFKRERMLGCVQRGLQWVSWSLATSPRHTSWTPPATHQPLNQAIKTNRMWANQTRNAICKPNSLTTGFVTGRTAATIMQEGHKYCR